MFIGLESGAAAHLRRKARRHVWVYCQYMATGQRSARRCELMVLGHLAYLNAIEKINCAYCSYANGLLAYVREVASRTEEYWCPIKHARRVLGVHPRYGSFVDYGDADAYRHELERLRTEARSEELK